ncbi:alpha/beta hydrolase [Microbacterium sp. 179-I 3D4 NHS]|uniref:alpha/beta hydrolase n=1 Tax=Microbacterium sp. 179-I 3D4 NHS TaxID=3142381 RepID=UPI0039A2AB8B
MLLAADLAAFRRDVEEAEDVIAMSLNRISGGDVVRGAWGTEVRVGQTFWGFAEQAYPGGPRTSTFLAGDLEQELSEAIASRVNRLSVIDRSAAQDWVDAHPEFATMIGLIDPQTATKMYAGMAAESTRAVVDGEEEAWGTGPLAQLFAVAPFAIGTLNGAPATARDEFNRETLRRVLADSTSTEEQRTAAEQTQKGLERAQESSPDGTVVQLVALELPDDGGERDMRAAISVGDLDTARHVGVMIPGMDSSVAVSMDGLVGNAVNMQDAHVRIGNAEATATVVWMGFESPGADPLSQEFFAEEHLAKKGAPLLVRFLNGVDVANPAAETTVHAHSYTTRLATYALGSSQFGGAEVDHLVMYGSPGIAESVRTVDDLVGVPPDEVYSTKSVGDQLEIPLDDVSGVPGYVDDMSSTGDEGQAGLAEVGEQWSDVRGEDNVDPNDASFWAGREPNVFESDGVLGHSADRTKGSDGYWSRGSDSIKDGARITAGRGNEVR